MIIGIAKFTVPPENLEEVKQQNNYFANRMNQNEYNYAGMWCFNDDATELTVTELFNDSAALVQHLEEHGREPEQQAKLAELSSMTSLTLYGDVSAELKEMLAPFGTQFLEAQAAVDARKLVVTN